MRQTQTKRVDELEQLNGGADAKPFMVVYADRYQAGVYWTEPPYPPYESQSGERLTEPDIERLQDEYELLIIEVRRSGGDE